MPSAISPRVARELNVALVACFTTGINDGISQIFEYADDGKASANVLETVLFSTIGDGSAEGVYTYAPTDYTMYDDTAGDEVRFEGSKLMEQRIPAGGYKNREVIVKLTDYLDDRVGLYKSHFHTLGTASVVAPYRRIVDTMSGAGSLISTIDDVAFFSQAHPQRPKESGGTAWSNDLVQAGGLTHDNFSAAWAAMSRIPGEDGRKGISRATHLLVGPTDREIAFDICFSDRPRGAAGGGNSWRGQVIPVVIPDWDGSFYQLHDCRSSIDRAFVYQEREPNQLKPIYTDPESPWVIDNNAMKWRLQGRYNVGLGNPRRALRSRKS